MNYTKHAPELTRAPVTGFCLFDEPRVRALTAELHLALAPQALFHIQHVYRTRERRDPTVGELVLCNAFAKLAHALPQALRLSAAEGDPALTASLRDLQRKNQALSEQAPPTLPQALEVLPRYLARSGFHPKEQGLCAAPKPLLTALCRGALPPLSLSMAHTAACILDEEQTRTAHPASGAMVMLTPTGNAPFEAEVATLVAAPIGKALTLLAATGEEGLLPHLLTLDGVTLNADALPGFPADGIPADLVCAGKNALLFHVLPQYLPALLAHGANLSVIGALTPNGRLQLYRGANTLLSLPLALLGAMRSAQAPKLTLSPLRAQTPPSCGFCKRQGKLLCGIELTGDTEEALLAFFRNAAARGADLAHATLSVTLLTPPGEEAHRVLPLLLGYHRAAAELMLPAVRSRVAVHRGAPLLAVYLVARAGEACALDGVRDFAALRARICNK